MLHSGLIPLSEEDKYIDVALEAMKHKSSMLYRSLMDKLFASNSNDAIDYTFDGVLTKSTSFGIFLFFLESHFS